MTRLTHIQKTARLQELLDQWREQAKKADYENETDIAATLTECADQLQAVLDA